MDCAIHLYDSEWVRFWALGFSLLFPQITNCSHKSNRDTSEAKGCMCICLVMSEVEADTEPRSRHQKHKRAFNKGIGHHGNHQLASPKKKKFFALMERAFSTICPSFPSSLYPPQKEKCWMRLWSSAFHLSRFLTSCFNHSPAMLENPHLICKDVLLFSTAIWISSALWSVSFLTLSYNILMCFTN